METEQHQITPEGDPKTERRIMILLLALALLLVAFYAAGLGAFDRFFALFNSVGS